jgi:hypothetical protein
MPKSRLNDFFELESNSAENRALIRPSLGFAGSTCAVDFRVSSGFEFSILQQVGLCALGAR